MNQDSATTLDGEQLAIVSFLANLMEFLQNNTRYTVRCRHFTMTQTKKSKYSHLPMFINTTESGLNGSRPTNVTN